jgi:hypothetical protein
MTLDHLIQMIPATWMLMSLAEDPKHGAYCCLRTREPVDDKQFHPAAISFGRDYVEALSLAIEKAKKVQP